MSFAVWSKVVLSFKKFAWAINCREYSLIQRLHRDQFHKSKSIEGFQMSVGGDDACRKMSKLFKGLGTLETKEVSLMLNASRIFRIKWRMCSFSSSTRTLMCSRAYAGFERAIISVSRLLQRNRA